MERSFGPYEVLERVAQGSTGIVYRARHVELDREAAIKELNPEMLDVPGMRERLRAEAETLAGLADPHVVEVFDYVEEDDRAWIAEEWVRGAPLGRILDSHGPLTPEQSVGVVRGAVTGLAHAHDRELLHRDVSPGNILADMEGTSKLVDFGLAAPVGEYAVLGTPAYMSPEASLGEALSKPSDVYSAAAVLYTLLSGRPPYPGSDVATTLRRHRSDPVPVLEGHGADLQDLLRRSMAKDLTQRPPDARAFLAELEEAARRRFGATWLDRASIAGVVAAVVGTPAAVAGVAAGGTTAAAPTVVVDAAAIVAGAGGHGHSGGTRTVKAGGRKLALLGAATAVVVAGAAATAVALAGGSPPVQKPSAAAGTPAPSEPVASPSPTEPSFEELSPAGKYRFTLTRVSSTYDNPPPRVQRRQWTLDLTDCTDRACEGEIESSSGSTFLYKWDGTSIQLSNVGGNRYVYRGPCVDDVTGEEVPGSRGKLVEIVTYKPLRVTESDADGTPIRFEGVQTYRTTYEGLTRGCRDTPADRAKFRMLMVRS